MTDRDAWIATTYQSGTRTVSRAAVEDARRPHFHIYGPRLADEDARERAKHDTQHELCAWLNGGPPPAWLSGLRRGSENASNTLIDDAGRRISVTGPFVDANPPALDWKLDMDPDFVAERKAMIWALLRGERP